MITFSGTYTRAEWLRGLNIAMRPSKGALALRLLALALFVVALGIIAAAFIRGEPIETLRLIRNVMAAVVLGFWAIQPFLRARQLAAAQWKRAGGKVSLSGAVTEEGIQTNASPEIDRWNMYLKAVQLEDMVVLMGGDGLATILPQRFFPDDRAWRDFRAMVEFKVRGPLQ